MPWVQDNIAAHVTLWGEFLPQTVITKGNLCIISPVTLKGKVRKEDPKHRDTSQGNRREGDLNVFIPGFQQTLKSQVLEQVPPGHVDRSEQGLQQMVLRQKKD